MSDEPLTRPEYLDALDYLGRLLQWHEHVTDCRAHGVPGDDEDTTPTTYPSRVKSRAREVDAALATHLAEIEETIYHVCVDMADYKTSRTDLSVKTPAT